MSQKNVSEFKKTITDHDILYVQFAFGMSDEHFEKYSALPRSRQEYLFSLWVKRHHPDKVNAVVATVDE